MSNQEARRAQLKAEIRREIDANSRLLVHTKSSLPKTGTPASKVVVAATPNHFKEYTEGNDHVPTSSPARRSELFVKNFHSTQAINCIRQTSTRVESSPARVNSPRRRASSPQLNPSIDANSVPISPAALPAAPPASAERSFAFSTSSESELRFSRAGLVHRSSFDHHKNIVFPDPSGQNEHSKLWLSKPLADGSRHAQTKRMFHDVQRDSTPKRSESPGGKRRITAPDHLSGSAATVTPDAPPVPVTGRRHVPESSSRTDSPSRAPYFESALERPSSTGRNHGLLGYGPTGKSFANRPVDHPRLLDEDNGKVGGEAVQRGVRPVAGKSFTSINVTTLHEYPAELVHEEKFKPSVVVLHGPPAFVPPPLPQRTQSPRRGTPRASDNDIFNTAPQSVNASAPAPPLRVGRGVGVYSPARSERPW